MAEQQFPDWIEKYRATIPQPQQEKTSRFDWWWIASLVLTLTFVAGLVHILWITYRTRPWAGKIAFSYTLGHIGHILYLVNFEVTNLKSFFLAFAHFPRAKVTPKSPAVDGSFLTHDTEGTTMISLWMGLD
jgi:hypothetical protein